MLLCSKWLPTLILPLLNWNHTCDIRRGFETFRPAVIVNVKSVMAQNYTTLLYPKLRISRLFSHTCCCEPDPGQIRCCDRCRCQIMFDCLIPLSRVSHCCCTPQKAGVARCWVTELHWYNYTLAQHTAAPWQFRWTIVAAVSVAVCQPIFDWFLSHFYAFLLLIPEAYILQ